MNILITTPGGSIGSRIVRDLMAPEFSVRVITRDPLNLPREIRREVEIIRGSLDDAAILREALKGADSLFWCVPSESPQETDVSRYYERFTHAAAQAIRDAETPRVVAISTHEKSSALRPDTVSARHAAEEILNQSGAAIRHLRCGFLMENLIQHAQSIAHRGIFSYPIASHIPISFTAAEDVADIALRWLVRRDWSGVLGATVHGPDDLSFSQVAAMLERVFERPVQYREMSSADYERALIAAGASTAFAKSECARFADLAAGVARAELRTFESTTPTSLAAWALNEFRPLIDAATPPLACACSSDNC